MSDWAKDKAKSLLASQVKALAVSQCPEPSLAEGMVQMAYALGLINDADLGYWTNKIAITVSQRRDELGQERIQRILAEGPQIGRVA